MKPLPLLAPFTCVAVTCVAVLALIVTSAQAQPADSPDPGSRSRTTVLGPVNATVSLEPSAVSV